MSFVFPHRLVDRPEHMDNFQAPAEELTEDLKNLSKLNRWLRARSIMLSHLTALMLEQRPPSPVRILDVGTGGADLPVEIACAFRARRWPLFLIGVDFHPTTIRFAAEATSPYSEIALVRTDALSLPFQPRSFHYVLASQVLHHFGHQELVSALKEWTSLATHGIIVSDLLRSPLAYAGIFFLTRLMTKNRLTRHDAPLSIRRGFSRKELRSLRPITGLSYTIHLHFPYRFCLVERLTDRVGAR